LYPADNVRRWVTRIRDGLYRQEEEKKKIENRLLKIEREEKGC